MWQDVAVVDIPRKLHQLLLWNLEIGIGLDSFVILSHGPSNAQDRDGEGVDQGSVLPSVLVFGNVGSGLLTEVFVYTS